MSDNPFIRGTCPTCGEDVGMCEHGMPEAYPDFGRPTGDALTISKQQRKLDQMRQTIDQLHERLAAVQSSKRNKASQIARLNDEIERLRRDGCYPACDGRTHWPGCWSARGHHECAMAEIERLRAGLREILTVRCDMCGPNAEYVRGFSHAVDHAADMARRALQMTEDGGTEADE